jgi:ADP-ribose pyrophosphatase YjhB (NUDIX family)
MAKVYSVYFDSRKIVITSKVEDCFKSIDGLFVQCKSLNYFAKLLQFFKSSTSIKTLIVIGDDEKVLMKQLSHQYTRVKAAGGLVQNADGEYLLIKRNGIWDLPKGKADENEIAEKTALREVEEECGISSLSIEHLILKTYHTYCEKEKDILKVTSWFFMKYTGNELPTPQTEEGISEVKWVSKTEIGSYLENSYGSIKSVFVEFGLI